MTDFSTMRRIAPGFYVDDAHALHVNFPEVCAEQGVLASEQSYNTLRDTIRERLPDAELHEHERP